MKHIIKLVALAPLAAIAWHVGGMIPAHTMTLAFGFVFGAFVGIPAMLIIATRAQTVRHDHYVHTPTEAPTQPRIESQRPRVRIAEKPKYVPTRYTVVANRPALPTVAQSKLEVKQ